MAKALQYPGYFAHRFVPIARSNYTAGRGGNTPQYVVLHIMQGTYAGSISWAQNPQSGVSWHYACARDGHTTQNLGEQNTAWTNSNFWYNQRAVTIEHGGYVSQGGPTEAQLHSSAKLTAGICYRYNIPINRSRILGHYQIPGANKPCPGANWPWARYISLVKQYARNQASSSEPSPSNPSPSSSLKPRKKIDLERVNICFRGAKDRKTASAFRAALNSVAKSRKSKLFARIVGSKPQIRYAATQAWNDSKNDYLRTVLIGRPAVKELDNYMVDALEKNDSTGRVIAANGNNWNHTNQIASWRLSYICDELGFGQSEKDKALEVFKKQLNLAKTQLNSEAKKPDSESNVPKKEPVKKPINRGPDKNATAPRTRFTDRISYSVWGRRAQAAAREIYGLYGKQHSFVSLHTYIRHDGDPVGAMRRGESQSLDFYVTGFGKEPTAEQQRVLQQAVDHAVNNWNRLGLDKIIANRQYTRDGKNWYPYKWWTFKYAWGKLTRRVTKDHRDHGHFRFGNWG